MSGTSIASMSYETQNEALNAAEFEQNNEVIEASDFSGYYHKKIRAEQVSEKIYNTNAFYKYSLWHKRTNT